MGTNFCVDWLMPGHFSVRVGTSHNTWEQFSATKTLTQPTRIHSYRRDLLPWTQDHQIKAIATFEARRKVQHTNRFQLVHPSKVRLATNRGVPGHSLFELLVDLGGTPGGSGQELDQASISG